MKFGTESWEEAGFDTKVDSPVEEWEKYKREREARRAKKHHHGDCPSETNDIELMQVRRQD
jgi:hypothetical protein